MLEELGEPPVALDRVSAFRSRLLLFDDPDDRVDDLARDASMSPRHFSRIFTDETGEAPGAYVERVRTDAARRALTQSDDTMPVIATRCGFGSAETMRRTFVRRLGVPPDQYRRTFS